MDATMNGTFHLADVVAVLEARKGHLTWRQLAENAGLTERQMSRIVTGAVSRPHARTLAGLEQAVGLPPGTLSKVGAGTVTVDEAAGHGRTPELEARVAAHEAELAEVRRLLTDVLRRLEGR